MSSWLHGKGGRGVSFRDNRTAPTADESKRKKEVDRAKPAVSKTAFGSSSAAPRLPRPPRDTFVPDSSLRHRNRHFPRHLRPGGDDLLPGGNVPMQIDPPASPPASPPPGVDSADLEAAQKYVHSTRNLMRVMQERPWVNSSEVNAAQSSERLKIAGDMERTHAILMRFADFIERIRTGMASAFEQMNFASRFLELRNASFAIFRRIGCTSLTRALELVGNNKSWRDVSAVDPQELYFLGQAFVPNSMSLKQQLPDGNTREISDLARLGDSSKVTFGAPQISRLAKTAAASPVAEIALHGARVSVPVLIDGVVSDFTLELDGKLRNDTLELMRYEPAVISKRMQIQAALSSVSDVPSQFKQRYVRDFLTVRDMLVMTPAELTADLRAAHALNEEVSADFSKVRTKIKNADTYTASRILTIMATSPDMDISLLFLISNMRKAMPEYTERVIRILPSRVQDLLRAMEETLVEEQKRLQDVVVTDMPLDKRILMSKMPDVVKTTAMERLRRAKGGPFGPDLKETEWLEQLLKIPFGHFSKSPITLDDPPEKRREYLDQVRSTLDTAVYGQDKAKTKVMELIGQLIANSQSGGDVIALYGPPGNGKTTFAREGIAKAMGRPFVQISLGGQSDGATFIGHDFTYVGSKPGEIVGLLQRAKCMNPVIYFDEVDKISQTDKGAEVWGILTHLIDPAQNRDFADRYFAGVPFDLSGAIFIFSFNDIEKVNHVVINRMGDKLIRTDPLTEIDKVEVAKRHLLPAILKEMNMRPGDIAISDADLHYLVQNYAMADSGARKVRGNLFSLVRNINSKRVRGDNLVYPVQIDQALITEVLGEPDLNREKVGGAPVVGQVNGLWANAMGMGGVLPIQVGTRPASAGHDFELILTGHQGDVMKESMSVAETVALGLITPEIRAYLRSNPVALHVHCPDTAMPKDGPSAGAAITLAVMSRLTNRPVRQDVAMTGEIDMLGHVKAIGGLRSKLEGAKRAGARLVLVPRENLKDLEEITAKFPELVDGTQLRVEIVDSIHEVIDHALLPAVAAAA